MPVSLRSIPFRDIEKRLGAYPLSAGLTGSFSGTIAGPLTSPSRLEFRNTRAYARRANLKSHLSPLR